MKIRYAIFLLFSAHSFAEFALDFAKNPLEKYHELRQRREEESLNFSFPELKSTMDTMISALSENKDLPQYFKRHITVAENLAAKKYPYASSILWMKTYLEYLSMYYRSQGKITVMDAEALRYSNTLNKLLKNKDIILIPTTDALSFRFFSQIQAVRAYPLGINLNPTIVADGRSMTPLDFFNHDIEHAEINDKSFINAGYKDNESMIQLQDNISYLLGEIDNQSKEIRGACELILFDSFHEGSSPLRCNLGRLKEHLINKYIDFGILIEDNTVDIRIAKRARENFYGEEAKTFINYLSEAHEFLVDIIEKKINPNQYQ